VILGVSGGGAHQQRTVAEQFDISGALRRRTDETVDIPVALSAFGPGLQGLSIVAGDNSVVAWWSFTGLLTGAWLGRPPTGKPIRGSVFSFLDLVDGRIDRYRLFLYAEFPESVVLDTSRPNLG
jgi:predicted ester cyclase